MDGLPPTFIQKPIIKQEKDGKRLIFECKISAEPKPDLLWSHDDLPIPDSGRYLIYCDALPNNVYVACLEIDDIITSDGGKYKVSAKNPLGESNAQINLNLDSKLAKGDHLTEAYGCHFLLEDRLIDALVFRSGSERGRRRWSTCIHSGSSSAHV